MSLIFLSQQKAFDPLVLYTCLPVETVIVGFPGTETRSWQGCDSLLPASSLADWEECTHVCTYTSILIPTASSVRGCGTWWCHTSYQWWVQQPKSPWLFWMLRDHLTCILRGDFFSPFPFFFTFFIFLFLWSRTFWNLRIAFLMSYRITIYVFDSMSM